MDRLQLLQRFADKKSLGIEIAPYFNPIVAKSAGYNVLIVDVCDTATLRSQAGQDPNIATERIGDIEAVDIVADASDLIEECEKRGFSGKITYIVSSHNFEHLPNPIRFLNGCSAALIPGGVLTMAIPDCRVCFDHFRMPTRLSDWLGAYHHSVRRPAPETRFDFLANKSSYMEGAVELVGCDIATGDVRRFAPARQLRAAYAEYVADLNHAGPYKDAHCSTFFGASFELLVRDLRYLGLIDLEVVEVTPTLGMEFVAYLRKPLNPNVAREDDKTFYAKREQLLRAVNAELGSSPLAKWTARKWVRRLIGDDMYERLAALKKSLGLSRRNGP